MKKITITEGHPDTVPEQDLSELTCHLTDELFPLLRAVRDRARERIMGFVPHYDVEKYRTMHRNYGLSAVKKLIGDKDCEEMEGKDNGRMFFAGTEEKHVGMIGYQYSGNLSDGRKIYEIRFASTLPGWKGLGIFGKLNRFAYETVRTTHPDACITTVSASPAIISHYERHFDKWAEIYYACEESEIARLTSGNMIQTEREEMALQGFRLFCYDPQMGNIVGSTSLSGAEIRSSC